MLPLEFACSNKTLRPRTQTIVALTLIRAPRLRAIPSLFARLDERNSIGADARLERRACFDHLLPANR